MATISIPCVDLRQTPPKQSTASVEAEIFGCFAVHETWYGPHFTRMPETWKDYTVTHIPTGCSFVRGLSRAHALATADELSRSPCDWQTLTDPKQMTDAQKQEGRTIRARYATGRA